MRMPKKGWGLRLPWPLWIALAGLPGCFGSCEGCLSEKLGQGVGNGSEVLDRAADRPGVPGDPGPAGEQPETSPDRLWFLPRVDLSGLTGAGLGQSLGRLGFQIVECQESDLPEEGRQSQSCRLNRAGGQLQVELSGFADPDQAAQWAEDLLSAGEVLVRDEHRVLAVQLPDLAAARELVAKLAGPKVPSASDARKLLEGLGQRVVACERVNEQGLGELECEFEQGPRAGVAEWIELPDDELEEAEEAPEELLGIGAGQTALSGRVLVGVQLLDRAAARALLDQLVPGSGPKPDQLLVQVVLAVTKPDGQAWDALDGAPDPYLVVNGRSLRQQRCQDTHACTFAVERADRLRIGIFDADAENDDPAGELDCSAGMVCETEGATVEVLRLW